MIRRSARRHRVELVRVVEEARDGGCAGASGIGSSVLPISTSDSLLGGSLQVALEKSNSSLQPLF